MSGAYLAEITIAFCLFVLIFIYICLHQAFVAVCKIFSCGMWDPVPLPGINLGPTALGTWHLSHWTTREVLI